MSSLMSLAEKISESYTLKMSMVDFIPGLLTKYASGEISKAQLITEYTQQTKNAYFYFRHMPKEDIQENKKLFHNEFEFANQLSEIIIGKSAADDEQFNTLLEKCMDDYLGESGDVPSDSP